MAKSCYVIKVSDKTKEKMIKYYKDKVRDKKVPYAVFQAEDFDTVITLYESNKAMFQGKNADMDMKMWADVDGQKYVDNDNEKVKKDNKNYYYVSSIGSDEVGTGDYFGPIVVTASFVSKDDIEFLQELKVKDSKKMSDSEILKVVPKLISRIKYRSIIMYNNEYNEKYSNNFNMNKIKAILHNKALWQLTNEEDLDYKYIIIDQFVNKKKYYEYLNGNSNIKRNITFLTKAEDKNLAVAVSALISRYIFLREFDKIEKKVEFNIPKGSSNEVDKIAKEIVKKYGKDILKDIAKLNFKNTEKVIEKDA